MPARAFPIMIAVGLLLLAAATSLFTVSEAQLAIRTEFGAIEIRLSDEGPPFDLGAVVASVRKSWRAITLFDILFTSRTMS